MIGPSAKSVQIMGKFYELKPCSKKNFDILNNAGSELSRMLQDAEITKWDYYDRLLRVILKDKVDFDVLDDEFDAKEAEDAILAFVPPSMQAYILLTGFQPV